ncbi:hypothetical protein [Lacinutrix salivirga]
MKKQLFPLLILSLILFSCGNSTEKCQYTKMMTVSYNFNKEASSKIIGVDTTSGCYSITKENNTADLKDSKNKFRILIKSNPNVFEITDGEKNRIWNEENGYKLGNAMSGDTLILRYVPTKNTPENILKFGTEYKFYN